MGQCIICGKETYRTLKSQHICKHCCELAMKQRDEHNTEMKEKYQDLYMALPKISRFVKDDPMHDRVKVTKYYILDKLYQEKK